MWLCTQYGFFSIVQKQAGQFHVRARCRKDLENLLALTGLNFPIHHSTDGDYAWRIVVWQEEVSTIMAAFSATINYPNFKSRIQERPDQNGKLSAYANLWSQMINYQAETAPAE